MPLLAYAVQVPITKRDIQAGRRIKFYTIADVVDESFTYLCMSPEMGLFDLTLQMLCVSFLTHVYEGATAAK